jgi:hypothetical protein
MMVKGRLAMAFLHFHLSFKYWVLLGFANGIWGIIIKALGIYFDCAQDQSD